MEKHPPAENNIAQWLEAHASHTVQIDVPVLQSAPVESLQQFVALLASYSAKAYNDSPFPYEALLEASQYAAAQYDQFAQALKADALSKGAEETKVDNYLTLYREVYIGLGAEATSILDAIKQAVEDDEHAEHVSVCSFPCGSGKSTALTKLIRETIERTDGKGLIIVTDSKERMKEYWNANTANPMFDADFKRFIAEHDRDVTVLEGEKLREGLRRQGFGPVLIMTTQRYFQSDHATLERFLHWERGTRSLIIFDEAPYLSQVREITPETFNQVDSLLRMKIEAINEEERSAKQQAIATWESLRDRYMQRLDALEYLPEGNIVYCRGNQQEELETLMAYVHEHASVLNTSSLRGTELVRDVCQLASAWGVYAHMSSEQAGKYSSQFYVHIDHRNLVTNIPAKVIVLDGTADLLPMYREDYIHRLPTRHFERSLSYLTLVLCDLDVTARQLKVPHSTLPQLITRYLADNTGHDRNLVLFTYQGAEVLFTKQGFDKDHTGHFNNIKGLNSYATATNIAQIGLNRMPSAAYLTMDLAHDEASRVKLDEVETDEAAAMVTQQACVDMDYNVDTAVGYMLADIEQNFYRSAIRRIDNLQPVTYYLFFNHGTNRQLIDAIRERYGRLGAKVRVVEREELERYRPTEVIRANIMKLQQWYDGWDGHLVKKTDILRATNLNRNQFDNALKHPDAAEIKFKFDAAKEKAAEQGRRRGYYMK